MCKIPQDCQWPVKRLKDVKIKEKTQKLNMQLIIKYGEFHLSLKT